MSNIQVKLQAWNGQNWDWSLTGPDTPYTELETLRNNWLSQITNNASLSGFAPEILKGSNNSSNQYLGWTVYLPQPNSARNSTPGSPGSGLGMYWGSYATSTTTRVFACGPVWQNNGQNGGYGEWDPDPSTGEGQYEDTKDWLHVGALGADYVMTVAWDATDGEEFFSYGWNLAGADNRADSEAIYRDRQGNWQWHSWDSSATTVNCAIYSQENDFYGAKSIANYENNDTQPMRTLRTPVAEAFPEAKRVYPMKTWAIAANQNLLWTNDVTASSGAWAAHPSGDAYIKMAKYGAAVRYTTA